MSVTIRGLKDSIFTVFLLSVYINELPEVFFKENLTIADAKKNFGSKIHQTILQNDVYSGITRSQKSHLNFNFTKFKVMKFSLQKSDDQELTFQANEHQIKRVKSIRDLSVNVFENFFGTFTRTFFVEKSLQKLESFAC